MSAEQSRGRGKHKNPPVSSSPFLGSGSPARSALQPRGGASPPPSWPAKRSSSSGGAATLLLLLRHSHGACSSSPHRRCSARGDRTAAPVAGGAGGLPHPHAGDLPTRRRATLRKATSMAVPATASGSSLPILLSPPAGPRDSKSFTVWLYRHRCGRSYVSKV